MAISLVGTPGTGNTNNGNDVVIALTSAATGDVVVAFGGHPYRSGGAPAGATDGTYTTVYSQDTSGTSFWVGYKVMGATPDADFTGEGSGNTQDATAYCTYILRGVNATPQDATRTTAAAIDPASIVTVTDGAWVIVMTGGVTQDASPGNPSGYGNVVVANGNDTYDIVACGATFEKTAHGTEDPGAWSTLSTTSPISVTTAWRPVSTTNVNVGLNAETDALLAMGRKKAKTLGVAW